MTREEAVKVLKRMIKTGIAYDDGYAFEPLTEDEEMACSMAIKALEQKPILDKIRAEILEEHENAYAREDDDTAYGLSMALDIFDKYKAESEAEE